MTELAHLLDQYLAARKLPRARRDSSGAFTFDAGDGLALCASTHKDGLELVANPGYLNAIQLEAVIEDDEDEADAEDDDDVLMRWQASGFAWVVDADRETGRVILSQKRAQAPRDLDDFVSALETMREVAADWRARLAAAPPTMPMRGLAVPGGLSYLAYLRI